MSELSEYVLAQAARHPAAGNYTWPLREESFVPVLREFHEEVQHYRECGISTHPKYKVMSRRS